MHSPQVQKEEESDKSLNDLSIYDNIENIEQKLLMPNKNDGKLDQSATLQLQINQLHLPNDMTENIPIPAKDTPQNQTQWGNLSDPYDIKKDTTPKQSNAQQSNQEQKASAIKYSRSTLNKIDEDILSIEKSLNKITAKTAASKKNEGANEIINSNRAPVIKAKIQPVNSKASAIAKPMKTQKIAFYLKIEYKPNNFIEMEVSDNDNPHTVANKLSQYFNLKQKNHIQLAQLLRQKVNAQIASLTISKSATKKGQPIMNLSLIIDDHIIPISIHQNDDVKALAKEVRKKHNLSREKESVITDSIAHSIEERKNKIALERSLHSHKKDNMIEIPQRELPFYSPTQEVSTTPTHGKTPLFRVNFNIKGTKNAHIDVYKDDSFHRLANEFAMTYKLGSTAINPIIQILQQKYNEHFSQ